MLNVLRFLVIAFAAVSVCASDEDSGPARQEFTPKSGHGRVVVLISGQSGMAAYRMTAQQIADAGFYVVLVDGNDFWIKDTRSAWDMLKGVITHAQAGSHVLPGKVGVVGYSLGELSPFAPRIKASGAALMLGADGALVGSRFCASVEAHVPGS